MVSITAPTVGEDNDEWGDILNTALFTLADAVSATESDISSLESTVATHTSDISVNTAAIASLGTRMTTAEGEIDTLQSETGAIGRNFLPADYGLVGWTDPLWALSGAGFGLVAGQIYLSKFKIAGASQLVSNIKYYLTVAQVGGTTNQNFVGLYTSAGSLIISSGDQTTNFSTTGEKTAAITPQTLAVGSYYVAFLANHATTAPSVAGGGGNSGLTNVGLTAATGRFLNTAAGNASLPGSITLASQSLNTASRWAGLT